MLRLPSNTVRIYLYSDARNFFYCYSLYKQFKTLAILFSLSNKLCLYYIYYMWIYYVGIIMCIHFRHVCSLQHGLITRETDSWKQYHQNRHM